MGVGDNRRVAEVTEGGGVGVGWCGSLDPVGRMRFVVCGGGFTFDGAGFQAWRRR